MSVEIVPYTEQHIDAVRAFNGRLVAAGVGYAFPGSNVSRWLSHDTSATLFQEFFLAVEDGTVRGGYILKHQEFLVGDVAMSIGAFQLPLSEGTIDRTYAAVGVQLLRHALRRQPLLYTLGIGSLEESAARLLVAAHFGVAKVPFFFRVEHAGRFLRQIRPLRSSATRRLACDIGAVTGLGALGIGLLQWNAGSAIGQRPVDVTYPDSFDDAVDGVWRASAGMLTLSAVRDQPVLSRLYDAPGNRFIRVVISEGGQVRGWAALLSTAGIQHKYFGDMKVGSIVDLLAAPGFERALIGAAIERLRTTNVDIIVTNQSLGPVCDGLEHAGFLSGPSNYLIAASPGLLALIGPLEPGLQKLHFGRGDGDGPINL